MHLSSDQGGHSSRNCPSHLTGQKWVTCLAQKGPWQEAETITFILLPPGLGTLPLKPIGGLWAAQSFWGSWWLTDPGVRLLGVDLILQLAGQHRDLGKLLNLCASVSLIVKRLEGCEE